MSGVSIPPFILGLLRFKSGDLTLRSGPFDLLPDNQNFGTLNLLEGALMSRSGAFISTLGFLKLGPLILPLGKSTFMSGAVISGESKSALNFGAERSISGVFRS